MKTLFCLSVAILYLIFSACNPSAGKELVYDNVKLYASLSNASEAIKLGDTLTIKLSLPDTIVGSMRTQFVQTLQRAFFAMYINKVDTINKKATLVQPTNYWTSVGTIENKMSYVLTNKVKPYEVVLNIKPPERACII